MPVFSNSYYLKRRNRITLFDNGFWAFTNTLTLASLWPRAKIHRRCSIYPLTKPRSYWASTGVRPRRWLQLTLHQSFARAARHAPANSCTPTPTRSRSTPPLQYASAASSSA